jgi:hypothetical protein
MATTIVFNHQIPHVEISGIYLNTSAVKKGILKLKQLNRVLLLDESKLKM